MLDRTERDLRYQPWRGDQATRANKEALAGVPAPDIPLEDMGPLTSQLFVRFQQSPPANSPAAAKGRRSPPGTPRRKTETDTTRSAPAQRASRSRGRPSGRSDNS